MQKSAFDTVEQALQNHKNKPSEQERAAAFELARRATGGCRVNGIEMSPHMLALFGFEKKLVQD